MGLARLVSRAVLGRRAPVVWFGVAALVAASAVAQTEAEGVRLDYQADPHCSAQARAPDTFVSEVHARSARVRFTADAPRKLVVRMVRDAKHGKLGGRIELHEADGTTSERTVSGATCEEVVSALGLVTALALDPLASTSADAATAATASATASASATATAPSATATSTAPPPVADAGAATAVDGGADVPLERRAWSFGAGADVEAVVGVTPDALLAVPVFFEATRAFGEHVGVGGGLRFERAGETSVSATTGVGADFTWTAASLDLCLVLRTGPLRFNGCARGTGGAVEARGEGVTPQRSATRPWVDLGASMSLRLRIAAPVFFEIAGQIGVALVQDTFIVEPSTTVFQVPGFVAHAGAGLGFEIW